jgi:pimeloyl-ACP methyl ester carboxylesterase
MAASEIRVENVERQPFAGAELEIFRGGTGPSLLLLHGSYGWWGWEPVLDRLAQQFTVVAPSHPGFGASSRNSSVDTVDDLAYYYLDLIEESGLMPARIVGFGMGGWIGAEIAVRCPHAVERLVLVSSVGIKISDRETRDIGDPFILMGEEHQAMLWRDPASHQVPLPAPDLPEDLLERMLRNAESAMLYGWKPYMHNPKLRQRLHRIRARTLVVWGDDDRIVSTAYGRAFAESIPGARFISIANAGHYPYREQLDAFARPVVEFLAS